MPFPDNKTLRSVDYILTKPRVTRSRVVKRRSASKASKPNDGLDTFTAASPVNDIRKSRNADINKFLEGLQFHSRISRSPVRGYAGITGRSVTPSPVRKNRLKGRQAFNQDLHGLLNNQVTNSTGKWEQVLELSAKVQQIKSLRPASQRAFDLTQELYRDVHDIFGLTPKYRSDVPQVENKSDEQLIKLTETLSLAPKSPKFKTDSAENSDAERPTRSRATVLGRHSKRSQTPFGPRKKMTLKIETDEISDSEKSPKPTLDVPSPPVSRVNSDEMPEKKFTRREKMAHYDLQRKTFVSDYRTTNKNTTDLGDLHNKYTLYIPKLASELEALTETPTNSSKIQSLKKRLNQRAENSIVDQEHVELEADIVCRLNHLLRQNKTFECL